MTCIGPKLTNQNLTDQKDKTLNRILGTLVLCAAVFSTSVLLAQEEATPLAAPDTNVLDQEQWEQLDESLQRGLKWLADQQEKDGSFESTRFGQPAVSSLCLMAFMAQGESPSDGKYQLQLSKAVDFILAQQNPNGLITVVGPIAVPIPRDSATRFSSAVVYNHSISALALCEVYGQCDPDQAKRLTPVIEKAIVATVEMQRWGPKPEHDVGGWRYTGLRPPEGDSDLSVTGWQLMFLRSAKNAGFDVPEESIAAAVKYVEGCFIEQEDRRVHAYLAQDKNACTRAMAGAGILALAHAGKHDSKEAIASGEWLLKHDFDHYNDSAPIYGKRTAEEHYHYASVLCSQAMFQLGGKYWEQFFPPLVKTLQANQKPNGAWPPEKSAVRYGSTYSTAMSVLALSVPNQLLPIFQR